MLQLKKIFPLLGLLVGMCILYGISEMSPVFAYTDQCGTAPNTGICFTFDSDSANSGYRFGMGARINVTGVTTQPANPVIQVIRSDGSGPVIFPMKYDSNTQTVFLAAISGLPTYMMIDSIASCFDIQTCDPFIFNMPQPTGFVVKYFSDGTNLSSPVVVSSTQTVTPATDGTIVSNPNQPYKNVRAACTTPAFWTTDGFCSTWKTTGTSSPPSALQIPFTASSVTATYKWTCATDAADQLASNFTKDWPCNISSSKDVYLEIDYMQNHRPDNSVILDLIHSFSLHNINLHVQLDERIPYKQSASGPINNVDSSDFTIMKNAYFGTPSERSPSSNTANVYCGGTTNYVQCVKNLLTAKRQVFHYVLFGDQQSTSSTSSGVSEGVNVGTTAYAANDIFITLGQWNYKKGSASQMESTLMHELGHNLGLNHGGPYALENVNQETDVNCKPNYLSVMSYTRQFPVLVPDRDLTYSSDGRNTANNVAKGLHPDDILENNPNGFTEGSISKLQTSTAYFFNQADPSLSAWMTTLANTPDWNNNGHSGDSIPSGTVIHANRLSGSSSMFPIPINGGTRMSIPVDCGSSSAVTLDAYDDWNSLGFNIWGSSSAYDGAGNGLIPINIHGIPPGGRP